MISDQTEPKLNWKKVEAVVTALREQAPELVTIDTMLVTQAEFNMGYALFLQIEGDEL